MALLYPNLFQPYRIKNTLFRNRILNAPSSLRFKSPSGEATETEIAYVEEKARGGAAQITIGETAVDMRYLTQKRSCMLTLSDPACWPSIGELTLAIRSHGAVPSIQLNHGGAETFPALSGGRNPIAPSGFIRPRDGVEVLEMTEAQIQETIDAFGESARLAQMLGFEMIMLHGGHGWLLGQFISPACNRRTDQWGGSLENRMRFPLAVIRRIREVCGPDFLIEYRLSGDEFIPEGMHLDDMIPVAKLLDGKVDLIHVSASHHGRPEVWDRLSIHPMYPSGNNVPLARRIKAEVSTPVVVVGAIDTPEQAEEILASGAADFVSIARSLIADPAFPNKAKAGRAQDIVPCTRCNNCLGSMAYNGTMMCSVNPGASRGNRMNHIPQVESPKRTAVIGGGPAGMQAALTLSERGHQVTLYEKSPALGGILNTFDGEELKADWCRYRDYMSRQVTRRVSLRLNTEASPEEIAREGYDAVFVAIGAKPADPPIPGIHSPQVISILDLNRRINEVGQQVVIIGGGVSGCEAAFTLSRLGRQVTVVEQLPKIGFQTEDASFVYTLPLVISLESDSNVSLLTATSCRSIQPGQVEVENADGIHLLPADTVVLAAGLKADWAAAAAYQDCAPEVIYLGDCVAPKRVAAATHRAYFAALDLL